jgi:hypothetical protein
MGEAAVGKSLNIIKKEDITLTAIADESIKNPTIKQDLLSTNKEIPTEYQTSADKKAIEDAGKSESNTAKDVIPQEKSTDADIAKVQEKITTTPEVKNSTLKQYADIFYTQIFDKFHPVYMAVKNVNENGVAFTKGGKLDPYENMRSQPGMVQTAMNFILQSPIKFKDLSNVVYHLIK